MITLYTFGPHFGLPDASPFVLKTMLLLRLAGLDYAENTKGFRRAPKGKLPYLDDDGEIVADSTLIRAHLERKYGVDFDHGLSAEERAVAWAVQTMVEDHLYWGIVDMRWNDDANFARGPATFFAAVPAPLRPLAVRVVRRKVRRSVHAHGLGRHAPGERAALVTRDIEALSVLLRDKPFLMGAAPCGADAAVFGQVAALLAPIADGPLREAGESHGNLAAYRDRILSQYFPARGAYTVK